jgi:hypothetical protein
MDLNQLYSDHQLAVMEAGSGPPGEVRRARQFDASVLAGRIGCIQRALGAGAAPTWERLAAPDVAELTSRSLALHVPGGRGEFTRGRP